MNRNTPTGAEKALREQSILYRRYRALKQRERQELWRIPEWGDRLRKLSATLHHFNELGDGDRMVTYVRAWARNMAGAPEHIRVIAFELIGEHIAHLREHHGLAPFDDPLPGEPDDVFQLCKHALGLMK